MFYKHLDPERIPPSLNQRVPLKPSSTTNIILAAMSLCALVTFETYLDGSHELVEKSLLDSSSMERWVIVFLAQYTEHTGKSRPYLKGLILASEFTTYLLNLYTLNLFFSKATRSSSPFMKAICELWIAELKALARRPRIARSASTL